MCWFHDRGLHKSKKLILYRWCLNCVQNFCLHFYFLFFSEGFVIKKLSFWGVIVRQSKSGHICVKLIKTLGLFTLLIQCESPSFSFSGKYCYSMILMPLTMGGKYGVWKQFGSRNKHLSRACQ